MRRAYSVHAVSAQAGSLAAIATTCSLATRFLLPRRLEVCARGGFLHSDGLAAPDFLQVVEVAHRGMHDVHDHVAEIHQYPLAARLAFDAVDARAALAHLFLHVVGERLHLARRLGARDHDPLEHRRHARGVVDMDVAALDVLQRVDHHALLLADVHLTVEPVLGDIVRHRAWHEGVERLAARHARADVACRHRERRHRHDDRVAARRDVVARAREDRDAREARYLRRLAPAAQARVLVAAEQQVELVLRAFAAQPLERIHRVRRSARLELAPVELVVGMVLGHEREHRQAVLDARHRRLAVAGSSGGNPQDPGEAELLHRALRDRQVGVVHRIERAAEDAQLQLRTSPWPSTTYFCVVRPSRPTGPRACSLSVEMPTSAPRPYSKPSAKRVDAFTSTELESTSRRNRCARCQSSVTIASVCCEPYFATCAMASSRPGSVVMETTGASHSLWKSSSVAFFSPFT